MNKPNTENSDVQYCFQVLSALEDLEKISYQRNELDREFQRKATIHKGVIAGFFALIIPFIEWEVYLFSEDGIFRGNEFVTNLSNLVSRTFAVFLLSASLFLLVFMILNFLWEKKIFRGIKKQSEKSLQKKLREARLAIDKKSQAILASDLLANSRIPEKFLSTQCIVLLLYYFEEKQASHLESAIHMLERDIATIPHFKNRIPQETLIEKEQRYST